jgi:hypothetical protein
MYDLNTAFADGCLEGLDCEDATDRCPFNKHEPLHRAAWLIGLDRGLRYAVEAEVTNRVTEVTSAPVSSLLQSAQMRRITDVSGSAHLVKATGCMQIARPPSETSHAQPPQD